VSSHDVSNIHSWSGLIYYIAKSLKDQNIEIDFLDYSNTIKKINTLTKIKKKAYSLIGKSFDYSRDPEMVKKIGQEIETQLNENSGIIFSPSSIPIALLNTKLPKVFYCDATFAGLIDYYEEYFTISNETKKNGLILEQKAFDNCSLAIFSSDWAAQTAINNYNVDYKKVKVIPFGANIECDRTEEDIKKIILNRSKFECNLLFIGVDWERKGGNMALSVTEKLRERGINAKLHIVGPKLNPIIEDNNYAIYHGFISKSTESGREKLDKLFSESHFFILPTKAEAFGLVFSEANSFGLPCIATNTGGIPTIIKDGINGKMFDINDEQMKYVDYIQNLLMNSINYEKLSYSSFIEYKNRLNWNVTGKKLYQLLKEIEIY